MGIGGPATATWSRSPLPGLNTLVSLVVNLRGSYPGFALSAQAPRDRSP
jgi:hypothetical protein